MNAAASVGNWYEEAKFAVACWFHDRVTDITGRKVYYGPNRGTAEWLAKGAYAWGCGHGNCVENDVGGFRDSLEGAKQEADAHATTHGGRIRAAYYEG